MARYSGPERRRYRRLRISLPVNYRLGPGCSVHKTSTIDISCGGICLGPLSLTNEWMLKSCNIELEIMLPEVNHTVRVKAEVVRIEGSKPHHIHHRCRHNIRLRFCKITEEDRKILEEFIAQHLLARLRY